MQLKPWYLFTAGRSPRVGACALVLGAAILRLIAT